MKYKCERCSGRGWDKPKRPDSFPDACAWCKGAGILWSSTTLAALLEVCPRTISKIEHGEDSKIGGARVVAAIARKMPGCLGIATLAARVALVLP